MDPLQNGLEDPGFQLVGAQHHRPGWLEPGQSPSTTLNPPPDAPCAPALMARPQGTGRGPRQDTANGYCRQLVIPCVAWVRHRRARLMREDYQCLKLRPEHSPPRWAATPPSTFLLDRSNNAPRRGR